jgi:hypothetical protein
VESLVQSVSTMMAGHKGLAAFLMLLVGLLITMGIGSSSPPCPSSPPSMCPVHPPRLLAHGDHRPGGHRGRAGGAGSRLRLDARPHIGPQCRRSARPHLGQRGANLHPLQHPPGDLRLDCRHGALSIPSRQTKGDPGSPFLSCTCLRWPVAVPACRPGRRDRPPGPTPCRLLPPRASDPVARPASPGWSRGFPQEHAGHEEGIDAPPASGLRP